MSMLARQIFLITILLGLCLEAAAQPATTSGEVNSTGTGFAVNAEGHLITNNHVVTECASVRTMAADGNRYDLAILARDARNDLALLKGGFPIRSFAMFRRNPVRSGDEIMALGFPYSGLLATDVNVSVGIVSAMAGLLNDTSKIQISAPVQPGNSGGPVLDANGAVAGTVVSKLNALAVARATGGDIPQNVNFAIKGELVQSFLRSNGVEPRLSIEGRKLAVADVVQQARPYIYLIECVGSKQSVASDSRNTPSQPTPPVRTPSADGARAQPQQFSQRMKEAFQQLAKEARDACGRDEYKVIHEKSACRDEDVSLEQLSDGSQIALADKPTFMALHAESKARRKKGATIFYSEGDARSRAAAEFTLKTETLAEANALALYEGSITWGQYNKRRKEIFQVFRDGVNKIMQGN